jgi:hypothetical protein
MNEKLLFTSLYFGSMMMIISIILYDKTLDPIYYMTWCGIITSCLNHGMTNGVAKWLDRWMMGLLAIVYLYYALSMNGKYLILFVIAFMVGIYLYSKTVLERESRTYVHMMVHLLGGFLFALYHFGGPADRREASPVYESSLSKECE